MKRRNLLKIGTLSALFPILPNFGRTTDCDPTTTDIEGPYYTPNAPERNKLSPEGAPGSVLFLTGTVYYNDCMTPIPAANLDVWQADDGGAYDNIGFNYRGQFNADSMGNYSMETVLPGKYLNGASYRPRHIHFKIGAPGSNVLTTQLYFEGDTDIPGDPWASDESAEGRTIPLVEDAEGNLHGVFDISLNLNPVINAGDDLKFQGSTRIISISPNPVSETGQVQLFLAGTAELDINIYSINGQLVKRIPVGKKLPGNHTIVFDNLRNEGIKLNAGIYILQLAADGKLIDAKRFMIL